MPRRLYVAGEGAGLVFCIAPNAEEAALTLGPSRRLPDPDDLRAVWNMARLGEMSGEEIREKYGVSRQTVDNWWRKAGGAGLPRRSDHKAQDRQERVKSTLLRLKDKRITVIAREANTSIEVVRDMAQQLGLSVPKWHRRPSDKELVEIAKGKTWMEFADAVGLKLSTLRAYIYARPKLSQQISKVRASATKKIPGKKIDTQKVMQLHKEGYSAYKIAQLLKVEQMSVRHWIHKLREEGSHDQARDERAVADAVAGSNGGAEL